MRMEPAQHGARGGETCAGVTPFRQGDDVAPLIAALRAHITRLEEGHARFERQRSRSAPWVMGLPELDRHLPAQGLLRGGLHDVSPRAHGDQPAALGFAPAQQDVQGARDPNAPASWGRVGRNEDCPCGSGKKFKHCHGTLV